MEWWKYKKVLLSQEKPRECAEKFRYVSNFTRSRSSKVINFGTNRKHVCDFLWVRHSNLGHILHCFRDIVGFCTPPLFHPILWMVFPLDQIADVWINPSIYRKLISHEIMFEVFQFMWTRYLNVTDGLTDRRTDTRTDDILWHNRAPRSIAR